MRPNGSPGLRASAAAGLGRLPDPPPAVLGALFAYLDQGGEGAAAALFRHAPAMFPGLNDRLVNRPDLRTAVAAALRDVRRMTYKDGSAVRPIIPGLIACFSDADADTRRYAAEVVEALGPLAAEAAPALLPLLADPEVWVRGYGLRALAKAHSDPNVVLAHAVAALSDPDRYVRAWALGTLANLPADPTARFPYLRAALSSDDAEVRRQAAEGLAKLESVMARPCRT